MFREFRCVLRIWERSLTPRMKVLFLQPQSTSLKPLTPPPSHPRATINTSMGGRGGERQGQDRTKQLQPTRSGVTAFFRVPPRFFSPTLQFNFPSLQTLRTPRLPRWTPTPPPHPRFPNWSATSQMSAIPNPQSHIFSSALVPIFKCIRHIEHNRIRESHVCALRGAYRRRILCVSSARFSLMPRPLELSVLVAESTMEADRKMKQI